MNLRFPLLALLVASPLAVAEAQNCIGSFALPPAGRGNFFVAGQVDQSDFAEAAGGRVGYVLSNKKTGAFGLHVGARTWTNDFDVESQYIDLQFFTGFPGKSAFSRSTCLVFGLDGDVSEDGNSAIDTYYALSFGHDFVFGTVALVPFATVGFNGYTDDSMDDYEYAGLSELGLGFRIGSRFTATLSSRTVYEDFERTLTRLVVAFPLGAR